MLKSHKDRYADIKDQEKNWFQRIGPIQKKFEFIKSWEQDGDHGEVEGLTDEDLNKVATLDDAWRAFQQGMWEAKNNIQKNFQDMKQEMESQISDLKSDVIENLKNFNKECPKAIVNKDNADKDENRRASDRI
jgi:seryl-tRNA synthetase